MPVIVQRTLAAESLPPRLRDLEDPPQALHLRGELPVGPCVAIVGTRRPTPKGASFARTLARKLAAAGVVIASGGAKGIDSEAHRGALEASGATLVVAPCGFERPFPPENAELFAEIVESGGAYVSLVSDEIAATRAAFFARNACLVALAHVVVVVQAPLRSGARNAAKHARKLGRPLLVVPAAPWQASGRGCLAELRLGARPLESARDVLKVLEEQRLHPLLLPAPGRKVRSRAGSKGRGVHSAEAAANDEIVPTQKSFDFPNTCGDDGELDRVVETIRGGATYPDAVCAQTGLAARRVQELILTLTLRGVLVADPSGRLRIAKSRI